MENNENENISDGGFEGESDNENDNDIEDPKREKEIEELEELLQTVPYNLQVALIKLSQLNSYTPLPLEKYYEQVLPTFHLLKRIDGKQYHSNSINSVRSAMLTHKLFYRDKYGLYALNIKKAINLIRQIKLKNTISIKVTNTNNFDIENKNMDMELNKINNEFYEFNKIEDNRPPETKVDKVKVLGRKRKPRNSNNQNELNNAAAKNYEKLFSLFDNLLKITYNDENLISKLNFDFDYLNDFDLNEDNLNSNKIFGMLTVFKIFISHMM